MSNSTNSINSTNSTNSGTITKQTLRRLLQDIKNILKDPESLNNNGIYYFHDEVDMLKGHALIVGPENTPYFGGFYFFEFNYPTDYPYSPPKVIFKTNGDNIRFNPNLYTSGKVCISILNTWKGEQWSSCQTISTILLTLCTLLCNSPLLNEPGIERTHKDLNNYTKIIEYKNIEIAILKNIEKDPRVYPFSTIIEKEEAKETTSSLDEYFYPIMKKHFLKNYVAIEEFIKNKMKDNPSTEKVNTFIYNMNVLISYNKLYNNLGNVINL